jgi:tetratricopeptide (TPR) repeat protein
MRIADLLNPVRLPGKVDIGQNTMRLDLLLPHHRPIRYPLGRWTSIIQNKFDRCRTLDYCDPSICQDLIGCYNEFALIETYFGRSRDAEYLCNKALELLLSLVGQTGRYGCYGAAFDPFVNLGRLERLEGNYDKALARFRSVQSALRGITTSLGPIELTPKILAIVFEDRRLVPVLREVFVVDSLKTLMKAHKYDEILQFACECEDDAGPSSRQFLLEACIVALGAAGECKEALRVLDMYTAGAQVKNVAVLVFRRAELLVAVDETEKALKLASKLGEQFIRELDKLGKFSLGLLYALARMLMLHRSELAPAVIRAGLALTVRLDEIPFRFDFLELLKKSVGADDSSGTIEQSILELRESSWWGLGGKEASSDPSLCCRPLYALFEELVLFAKHPVCLPASAFMRECSASTIPDLLPKKFLSINGARELSSVDTAEQRSDVTESESGG